MGFSPLLSIMCDLEKREAVQNWRNVTLESVRDSMGRLSGWKACHDWNPLGDPPTDGALVDWTIPVPKDHDLRIDLRGLNHYLREANVWRSHLPKWALDDIAGQIKVVHLALGDKVIYGFHLACKEAEVRMDQRWRIIQKAADRVFRFFISDLAVHRDIARKPNLDWASAKTFTTP